MISSFIPLFMYRVRVHISIQSYENNKGEWVILVKYQMSIFFSNINLRTRYISMRWCWCLLYTYLNLFSASAQTQPSAGWNVAPFGHIMMTPSLPVFALTPESYGGSRETANVKFIVCGLTRLALEPMIYHTRAEHPHHYASNTVGPILKDDTCTFKTPPRVLLLTSYLFVYMRIYIYIYRYI